MSVEGQYSIRVCLSVKMALMTRGGAGNPLELRGHAVSRLYEVCAKCPLVYFVYCGRERLDDDDDVFKICVGCRRMHKCICVEPRTLRPVGFVTRDLLNNVVKTRLAHYSGIWLT